MNENDAQKITTELEDIEKKAKEALEESTNTNESITPEVINASQRFVENIMSGVSEVVNNIINLQKYKQDKDERMSYEKMKSDVLVFKHRFWASFAAFFVCLAILFYISVSGHGTGISNILIIVLTLTGTNLFREGSIHRQSKQQKDDTDHTGNK